MLKELQNTGVLQAPDTLYSHQKIENYSINIANLAIEFPPKKAAQFTTPILENYSLLTF